MSFSEVVGQKKAIDFLTAAIRNSRVPHAYLFSGPEGVGKVLVARQLAKLFNCELNGVDCCDQCPQCRKIDNSNHPDVKWIGSLKKGGEIKINQIREMKDGIYLRPYESAIKICIILEAENLTTEASNAFLKTLEEPPGASLLILTSSNLGRILPTVISRCQIVRFNALGLDELKEFLKCRHNLEEETAHFLAYLSEGSIGKALALNQADIFKRRDEMLDGLRLGFDDLVETCINSSYDIHSDLELIINLYRDLMVLKESGADFLINIDRKEELSELEGKYSTEGIIKLIESINQIRFLIRQNVNPRIALQVIAEEMACLK